MSESNSFSIGVFPEGKPEKHDIDADYLVEKGFTCIEPLLYSKEMEGGKMLLYNLGTYEILIKKGDADPVVVAECSPSVHYIEGLWKTLSGENL